MSNIRAPKMDWLALALGTLGGAAPAARACGASQKTVYAWLNHGLGKAAFDKVVKLSEKSNVPLEYLARRLGPWRGPFKLPSWSDASQEIAEIEQARMRPWRLSCTRPTKALAARSRLRRHRSSSARKAP